MRFFYWYVPYFWVLPRYFARSSPELPLVAPVLGCNHPRLQLTSVPPIVAALVVYYEVGIVHAYIRLYLYLVLLDVTCSGLCPLPLGPSVATSQYSHLPL